MTICMKENGKVLGILGGGQLGRMMVEASHRLGLKVVVLDPKGSESPAQQINGSGSFVSGAYAGGAEALKSVSELAEKCNVITIEIEHVDAAVLLQIQQQYPAVQIHPSPETIRLIQDKYEQKQFLRRLAVPVADFALVDSIEQAEQAGEIFGYPYMLKSRFCAYDGRGNVVIDRKTDIPQGFAKLKSTQLYAEKMVSFEKELAVMVAAGAGENDGERDIRAYPVVETRQKDSICHTVLAPAQVSDDVMRKATEMAISAVKHLSGYGMYGVEMFLTTDHEVILNEIAPRVHNSGHFTIEACETDQFEQHLRAVTSLPLGSCKMRVNTAVMLNILGDKSGTYEATYKPMQEALAVEGAGIHYYGKKEIIPGRKLAHLTVVASDFSQLKTRMGLIDPSCYIPIQKSPVKIGIIMGSDSDLPCMSAAAEILEEFNIGFELLVVSAHRTPDYMYEYAKSAPQRGIQIIIAGAGGAAHLPGMVAALTHIPVIGVPIKSSALSGYDSLLSIVQMPRGVPVATVAIGNAKNAGLLAIRMLGIDLSDNSGSVNSKMISYLKCQKEEVFEKVDKIKDMGYKKYLKEM